MPPNAPAPSASASPPALDPRAGAPVAGPTVEARVELATLWLGIRGAYALYRRADAREHRRGRPSRLGSALDAFSGRA